MKRGQFLSIASLALFVFVFFGRLGSVADRNGGFTVFNS
ncbi:hypothetical protein B0813_003073 [Candidatus Fervidibacteria bacterium JGI MDM2 SSWTFF-3-K9]